MMASLARRLRIYTALAAVIPKIYMAYSAWFWASLILNMIAITIYVYFWRAVYSGTASIANLSLDQTLQYILLAQILGPIGSIDLIFEFGYNLREGGIAHVLLRPVDVQGGYYGQYFARMLTELVLQIPLAVMVVVVFHMRFPSDLGVWAAFIVSVILGRSVIFFFDWMLGCLTFYTTETWGLGVLVFGIGLFLSGSLVPLAMLPGALQAAVTQTPFAQSLYVPLSILSGIAPLSEAPRLWLIQAIWMVALLVLSRLVFKISVRKITVQGG